MENEIELSIRQYIEQLESAFRQRDPSLISRAIKISHLRKKLTIEALNNVSQSLTTTKIKIEAEVYLSLLRLLVLLDKKQYQEAMTYSTSLIKKLSQYKNQTLYHLNSKCYYYYALSYYYNNKLSDIRADLLQAYRLAISRSDEIGKATLINLILWNYLHYNLISEADQFRTHCRFPDNASNAQLCRFLFYSARINAIQLDYTNALLNVTQAIRKAPNKASGLLQTSYKLMIIVSLLIGEIPDKALFKKRFLKKYYELVKIVRIGNLESFNRLISDNYKYYEEYISLISRLRHNVIKTALRNINIVYSKISLSDIANTLHLNVDDCESVVSKAICDGIINASIDHSNSATSEPMNCFSKRIHLAQNLRNDMIHSMRYPLHPKEEKEEDVREDDLNVDITTLLEEGGDDL